MQHISWKAVKRLAQKTVKCRYSHCPFPDDVRPPNEMVKGKGNTYYHQACAHERDKIAEIVDYYMNNIDDRVTVAQLRNVINNIVFKKNVSADELFFDIWYTKTNNGKINSPYSLHYLIANKKLQAEYKKHLENKKPVVDIDTIAVSDEVTYTSKSKKSDFGGIF